ncbi:MAG: RNA polymerase sigma factor RpoH [Gammaproteobacteria bacterium]|nr:RNA polymerase sigma factor RpoH [Rhodocyclaceae bacterium]MBU3908189.1 RNA polymerase sigma factor RpoH [Gammaproteobacteria bacterium]MBU3988383.1 RNA polymerase sigma factor RpoH [Gammaproteobacteria bacterium]MBU4005986.1 RNA polymerase sigma factor RpoH [Gammaproteobacteria bacterium]MBU4020008.1 RNA polymerase sigma factor RpoH [Gammaproteobacteria bacterium]
MQHALTLAQFSLPSPTGSIEAYIQAANRVPLLTLDEEQELARRLRDDGDREAARRLVMSHLRLVIAVARGYLGYGLPHADLIQEGSVGLMKAVKRFDPERGVRLVSFALHWIKAEIHEYILKNWRLVKLATTKAQRKLFFNLRSMKAALAQEANAEHGFASLAPDEVASVARQLGVKPEEVVEMETRMGGMDISLEPLSDDDDDHYSPAAYLAADISVEPSIQLERKERDHLQDTGLRDALAELDDRSRTIVQRRWLVDDDESGATLHELASEYGVSAERIRQIEAKAMQKMKGVLAARM